MNTTRIVFLLSFLPSIGATLTGFASGMFDDVSLAKLLAIFSGAVITGTVNGLLAVKALNTEKAEPPSPKSSP